MAESKKKSDEPKTKKPMGAKLETRLEKRTEANIERVEKLTEERLSKNDSKKNNKVLLLDDGDNRKFTAHSLEVATLPPVDMEDNEKVVERIIQYFEICQKNDMKPQMVGVALALGMDRTTLYRYARGDIGKNPEIINSIKKTQTLLDSQMNDFMQNGKINPVSGIFLMKNHFGYSDKQELEVTKKDDEPQNEEQLHHKYDGAVFDAEFEEI